jgi:hypothetical protein
MLIIMSKQQRPIVVDAVETEEQRMERQWREICAQTAYTAAQIALKVQMDVDRCDEEVGQVLDEFS